MKNNHKGISDINMKEIYTFEKFCSEMGNDMDRDFCREIENELQECPECKFFYDTVRKTVQIYRVCEENSKLDPNREKRLFKVLNLEKPQDL